MLKNSDIVHGGGNPPVVEAMKASVSLSKHRLLVEKSSFAALKKPEPSIENLHQTSTLFDAFALAFLATWFYTPCGSSHLHISRYISRCRSTGRKRKCMKHWSKSFFSPTTDKGHRVPGLSPGTAVP